MADFDAPVVQQILHIPERQWEPDLHHRRQPDDLGRRIEIPERGAFCHPETLLGRPANLKSVSFDTAYGSVRRCLGLDIEVQVTPEPPATRLPGLPECRGNMSEPTQGPAPFAGRLGGARPSR